MPPAPATTSNDPATRGHAITQFIATNGWADATVIPMREDTSVRRYFRLTRAGKNPSSAILMDARPPMEDTKAFEFMDQKLTRLGFSVPEIYAANHDLGLILLEDFGDATFFNLINEMGRDPQPLLELAVDALVHKYKADPTIALEGSVAYSDDYWLFRVEQFLDHYLPHVRGVTVDDTVRADYRRVFKTALDRAHEFPDILLHGDFVVQNLMHLPDRPGVKALGIIDFQDMTDARGNMCGSPAFDLAFLVHDVRADYPPDLRAALKARFIQNAGISDTVQFEYEYATIVAAQAAKCLGLFARFGYANNRPEYLAFIPYCWRNLRDAFLHPGLADLKAWFDQNGGVE
jgi:aminoglycoside/choline kinase family phosphotransferase